MPQIIAGLYELKQEIGSGGGGTVYLGQHTRLEKPIVLKADKRKLSAGTEKLRREVDLLKGLHHTYIPQVYDFVQEKDVVFTVMDYIEGESLDKLLDRHQIPAQPQVIRWACQLLEALAYLHSRPPHGILHGDIKPANIMLRPNGEVCLIDFNIALALGEDGAVKVGFSRGYASPEHYGADYILPHGGVVQKENNKSDRTEIMQPAGQASFSAGSVTRGQRGVLLDVRSDIYSLGATLYHLISGQRPAEDAKKVRPLGSDVCSAAVSAILQKAMAPQPDQRYRSAEEMLEAFLQLHRTDKRAVRHRRRMAASAAVLAGLFLAGGACTFVGLKQMEQRQSALALSEYSANALAEGNVSGAVRYALQAIPSGRNILEASVTAEAQKALTDALGVYDLSDGFRAADTLELPGAPFCITVSPEGTRFAAVYAYEAAVFDMADRHRIAALPTQNSALSDCIFIDEDHILYAGEEGITAYDLSRQEIRWTGEPATTLALSADGRIAAAVNREEDRAVIYRVSDGVKVTERSFDGLHLSVAANDIFADPEDDIFALNKDGSMLAVSFYNGGFFIFDLNDPDEDLIIYDESDFRHFEGGFCGDYFAFISQKGGEAQFGIIDAVNAKYIGGYSSRDPMVLQADEQGVYLAGGNLLVRVDLDTFEEQEAVRLDNANFIKFSAGQEYVLAAADDGSFKVFDRGANPVLSEDCGENCDFVALSGQSPEQYAVIGNRNEPVLRILKEEGHAEAQLLTYDAQYRHDEARISGDAWTAMLFSYHGFAVYDMEGSLIAQADMPEAADIYDQQFVKGETGSYLEVLWYDGTVRQYDAKDGALLSEQKGEAPDKDLYEEFYTDRYRIASSLHAAPEVYDLKSGRFIASLETDSYLAYVTQMGEYIITEYVSAAGERYGLLLDGNLQTLAYLPNLCDISGDMLVFDHESGNLRQSRLYSLQELVALGETYQ